MRQGRGVEASYRAADGGLSSLPALLIWPHDYPLHPDFPEAGADKTVYHICSRIAISLALSAGLAGAKEAPRPHLTGATEIALALGVEHLVQIA